MSKSAPKILSLKLKKKGIEVSYTDRSLDGNGNVVENEISSLLKVEPHPDLLAEVAKLSKNFAELLEEDVEGSADIANDFPVRGVIFKSTEKYEGAILTGYKRLSTGHVVNMLTRLVKYSEGSDPYEQAEDMQEKVDNVRVEVLRLLEGKHGKPAQTSITDPEQAVAEEA